MISFAALLAGIGILLWGLSTILKIFHPPWH